MWSQMVTGLLKMLGSSGGEGGLGGMMGGMMGGGDTALPQGTGKYGNLAANTGGGAAAALKPPAESGGMGGILGMGDNGAAPAMTQAGNTGGGQERAAQIAAATHAGTEALHKQALTNHMAKWQQRRQMGGPRPNILTGQFGGGYGGR